MMTIRIAAISKDDSALFKGVGILLIVMHNFFHNLTPVIGENEFIFNINFTQRFISSLINTPENIINTLFSFLGHHGVEIFIFLSAYGLTVKYKETKLIYSNFIRDRFDKIYFTFILAILLYVLLAFIKIGLTGTQEKVLYWDSLVYKLLLVSNFISDEAQMPVGPWWFIPFIMQFYLVFPLMLWLSHKYGIKVLVVLSSFGLLVEFFSRSYLDSVGINLNYSFLGYNHITVIILGMYFALNQNLVSGWGLFAGSLIVFVLGNINGYVWFLSDLAATIVLLTLLHKFVKTLANTAHVKKVILFYGAISFHLFLVNGFLRSPTTRIAEHYNTWYLDIVMSVANLVLATFVAYLFYKLEIVLRRTRINRDAQIA